MSVWWIISKIAAGLTGLSAAGMGGFNMADPAVVGGIGVVIAVIGSFFKPKEK